MTEKKAFTDREIAQDRKRRDRENSARDGDIIVSWAPTPDSICMSCNNPFRQYRDQGEGIYLCDFCLGD